MTYDSSFHFYNLKNTLSEPQMMAVPDLDDPFLPLPSELLVNLQVMNPEPSTRIPQKCRRLCLLSRFHSES